MGTVYGLCNPLDNTGQTLVSQRSCVFGVLVMPVWGYACSIQLCDLPVVK